MCKQLKPLSPMCRQLKSCKNFVVVLCTVSLQCTLRLFHRLGTERRPDIVKIDRECGRWKTNEFLREQALDIGGRAVEVEPMRPRLVLEVNSQKCRLRRCQTYVGQWQKLSDLRHQFIIPANMSKNECSQSQINHCAGCTMEGAPAAWGPPTNCQFFTTLF